jgi:UDP:flavonoid glycosyltransferase YjiC (YdhE family)
MRVLLSTYDSRGGVEPLVALAVRLRELGAEARVCAPPDCAERLAEVGVPLVPVGRPHHPPQPLPGRPFPPDVTDNRVLNDLDVQSYNALFGEALNTHRASIGLPPVDNARAHILGDQPWLAADPILAPWQEPADLDVVQTGAWILPDERPLPAELEAFLDAGAPPVYVGFGSMRAPKDFARVAIEAIRTQDRRALVAHGWADLALTPETRARATAVAGTIRTDGATVAATLLLEAVSRERPPASA